MSYSVAGPLAFFVSVETLDTGMPLCALRIIKHFAALAPARTHVFIPREGALAEQARQSGAQVHLLHFSRLRSPRNGIQFCAFVLTLLPTWLRLFLAIKRYRIRQVHFSDFIDHPYYVGARLAGATVIAHIRTCFNSPLARGWNRLWSALFVTHTICISHAAAAHAALPAKRITVIYDPGPDRVLFDSARTYSPIAQMPPGPLYITTIGKFVAIKGHDLFVQIAAQVRALTTIDCRFVIVGDRYCGHEHFYDSVKAQIDKTNLGNRFIILGQLPHEQIAGVLAATHIYVQFSRCREGLGGAILEAMAMGVPVVSFDSGGTSECFVDTISGLKVTQFNIEAAAEAIALLADNPDKRKQMGNAARAHSERFFAPRVHFDALEELYTSLESGKRRNS